jgi:dTDP-4-amino-4,6-dideoxygalactose transaminase
LDSIHAAQLRHALKSLDSWNARRREVAARYDKAFGNRAPFIDPIAVPVFHLYEYKCDSKEDREALMAWLGEAGVACGLHYPSIITDSTPYLTKDKGGFRVARDLCDRLLSLPVFPTMTNEQVDEVIAAVEAYRSQ